jgi:hypothetical protein
MAKSFIAPSEVFQIAAAWCLVVLLARAAEMGSVSEAFRSLTAA